MAQIDTSLLQLQKHLTFQLIEMQSKGHILFAKTKFKSVLSVSFLKFIYLLYYCCTRGIVTFTKVLRIYYSWIYHLHHYSLSPLPSKSVYGLKIYFKTIGKKSQKKCVFFKKVYIYAHTIIFIYIHICLVLLLQHSLGKMAILDLIEDRIQRAFNEFTRNTVLELSATVSDPCSWELL
jgi:hypothetical protein